MPKYQAVSDNAKEKTKRSFVFEVAVALAAPVAGLSTREVLPLVLAVLFPLICVFTERGWKQIVMGVLVVAAVAAYVSVFGWNIR